MGLEGDVSLKGKFIMAMPGLMDPNFQQTVTLICEHTPEGAMGVIVNRKLPDLTAERIYKEIGMTFLQETADIPVYFGGPVHTGEIFIVHGPPYHWNGCLQVNETFALSNTPDILQEIAMGRGPEDFLIVLGCSGWGEKQLEGELMDNAWLTNDAAYEIVFKIPAEQRWDSAIERLGIDPDLLTGDAGHA